MTLYVNGCNPSYGAVAWDEGLHWHLEQLEPPQTEPFETAFVRDEHLRCANGDLENPYVERLITLARRAAERATRRSLMLQTWLQTMDRFPLYTDFFELQRPPLVDIEAVEYLNGSGEWAIWDPANYVILQTGRQQNEAAKVGLAYGVSWPTVRTQRNAVRVTYRAGYLVVNPEVSPIVEDPDVPEEITQGMLLLIGELYKQRSESVPTTLSPAVIRAKDLWATYKVY